MDSEEKTNIAQPNGARPNVTRKEPPSFGEVARRVGGALANLVPNSKPLYRERLDARAEPSLSMPQDAEAEDEVVFSLDVQRAKRGGGGTRDLESPDEPLSDRQTRSLDALRKKKSA